MNTLKKISSIVSFCLIAFKSTLSADVFENLDKYNFSLNRVQKSAIESIPIGGGDMGGNVWVGDDKIYLYLQKSGSFSEIGEYLKLGRFSFDFIPNIIKDKKNISQNLILKDGNMYIDIVSEIDGKKYDVRAKFWIDIFSGALVANIDSNENIDLKVSYENWRTKDVLLPNDAQNARWNAYNFLDYQGDVLKLKDNVSFDKNTVLFYHKNPKECMSPDVAIKQQNLEKYRDVIYNPNSNRISGGRLYSADLIKDEVSNSTFLGTDFISHSLKSKKAQKSFKVYVSTQIKNAKDIQDWVKALDDNSTKKAMSSAGNPQKNIDWWRDFWNKSYIFIKNDKPDAKSKYWQMGKNYNIFRYQLGGNYYGEFPTKFNGGNLTVDPKLVNGKKAYDPDWRSWGGDVFTAQNQRLVYWGMLKSGDFDGMRPMFDIYKNARAGAEAFVAENLGHAGGVYYENINASGVIMPCMYGWDKAKTRQRGKEVPFGDSSIEDIAVSYKTAVEKGIAANGYTAFHWMSQLEFSFMILKYNEFTGRNIDEYIPFIKSSLIYFYEHYKARQQVRNGKDYDENGKLVLFPSQALEMHWGAKNPVAMISALESCLEYFLKLDSDLISSTEKSYYKKFLSALPSYSYDTVEGDKILKHSEFAHLNNKNSECPEMYVLFPADRINILDKENIDIMRNTWKHGTFPKDMLASWHQDGILYARMGMLDKAVEYNLKKFADVYNRFPTYWGPGHDWVPDHNHGGSATIGLQEMLMQTFDKKIILFPCWDKNVDVSFKMHAPYQTTVEVTLKDGKIQNLNITPKNRAGDIIILSDVR